MFFRTIAVVGLTGLVFTAGTSGQVASPSGSSRVNSIQPRDADRATPNQSLEVVPSGAGTAEDDTATVSNDHLDRPEQKSDSPGGDQEEARKLPVRTLRPRTTGTSTLGRPDSGNTPWYRSGIGALSIVLAVIVGVMLVVRRFVPSMRAPEGDVLKVVARASLSPKQSLSLIQLGRRFVLVALSSGRVDVLCEVDDSDEVAELMMATGAKFPIHASAFDVQLRTEASNYDDTDGSEMGRTVESPRRDRGRAVSDLLSRLKTLQQTD